MDERDFNAAENRAIRGYILRSLAKGHQNTMLCKQIENNLIRDELVVSPDITKYLQYLQEKDYIQFVGRGITAINYYSKDAVIRLTARGVDLIEGTIEDPGVDI